MKTFLMVVAVAVAGFCYTGTEMARHNKKEAVEALKTQTVALSEMVIHASK
jgi:hypothetical protein